MAVKISELPDLSGAIEAGDYLVLVDSSTEETVKSSVLSVVLAAGVAGVGGDVLSVNQQTGAVQLDAENIPLTDAEGYFDPEDDVEGALELTGANLDSLDTRVTDLEGASATFNPLSQPGLEVHLIYNDTNSRFEYPGVTASAADLTGRVCTIVWEATSGSIPAQGTGVTDFRPGDQAVVRASEYAS